MVTTTNEQDVELIEIRKSLEEIKYKLIAIRESLVEKVDWELGSRELEKTPGFKEAESLEAAVNHINIVISFTK